MDAWVGEWEVTVDEQKAKSSGGITGREVHDSDSLAELYAIDLVLTYKKGYF